MTLSLFQAMVLGIVQGLTEFLPISSSGHLILFPWLLGWPDPGLTFDVALHLGTLVALLAYFWRDWVTYISAAIQSILRRSMAVEGARTAWFLVLGSIPAAVIGKIGSDWFEAHVRQPWLIGVLLIVAGGILYVADRFGRKDRELDHLRWIDAVAIGSAQALALFPGVSRSGATITAGLFLGLTRETAARFAFLLAAPITAGAVAFKLLDVAKTGLPSDQQAAFAVGIIASGATGFLAIKWMLGYVKHRPLTIFVWYRLALGALVLLLSLLK